MKLFALPDGTINRKDRAQWLTMPFDLAFAVTAAAGMHLCGTLDTRASLAGDVSSRAALAGTVASRAALAGDVDTNCD